MQVTNSVVPDIAMYLWYLSFQAFVQARTYAPTDAEIIATTLDFKYRVPTTIGRWELGLL